MLVYLSALCLRSWLIFWVRKLVEKLYDEPYVTISGTNMAHDIATLLGFSVFPALVGMAFYSTRIKPGSPPLPKPLDGGFLLFLQVWAVAFVTALIGGFLFVVAGFSESGVSTLGHLVVPAVVAFYFTKLRHIH